MIPTAVGGWTIREVGLWDEDGDLIAYGNFPASYKPVLAEGSAKELVVRRYLETSGTAGERGGGRMTVIFPTIFPEGRFRAKKGRLGSPKRLFLLVGCEGFEPSTY